jgi:hypothetical protein
VPNILKSGSLNFLEPPRDCPGLYRDNFTFILSSHLHSYGLADDFANPGLVVFKNFYQMFQIRLR